MSHRIQHAALSVICTLISSAIIFILWMRDYIPIVQELGPGESTPGVGIMVLIFAGGSCWIGLTAGYILTLVIWHRILNRD